jgi:hypothetical protein
MKLKKILIFLQAPAQETFSGPVALDASHKKEAIAHISEIFGVFFGIPPIFGGFRHKNNLLDKLPHANMHVSFVTTYSNGFLDHLTSVEVMKISGKSWLVLFVRDCMSLEHDIFMLKAMQPDHSMDWSP